MMFGLGSVYPAKLISQKWKILIPRERSEQKKGDFLKISLRTSKRIH
jgi:hypothetical protein